MPDLFSSQVQNIGFGRNIGRKWAPHGIPYDLHGLGRSSLLTLAREGLVRGTPRGPSAGPTEAKHLDESVDLVGGPHGRRLWGRKPWREGTGFAKYRTSPREGPAGCCVFRRLRQTIGPSHFAQ
jgi:hypothetical protein